MALSKDRNDLEYQKFIELNGKVSVRSLSLDYLIQVKLNNIPGHRLIHKFGKNTAVGTTPVPISTGGVYQTPSSNQSVEILSDNVNDTDGGSGASKMTVQGLVFSDGKLVSQEEEVTMDGTTPVTLQYQYARGFRVWISETGTYATPTTVSSAGTITIRDEGGAGSDWLIVDTFTANNSAGQSQTALYTTPTDTVSVLFSPTFTVDSLKTSDLFFFQRPNADDVVAPFTGARRMVHEWIGVTDGNKPTNLMPVASFSGAVDMGFMGQVSATTGAISAEFWLLEIDI